MQTFVSYGDKSGARRGFCRAYKDLSEQADSYLTKAHGKWGFFRDEEGKVTPKSAPAAVEVQEPPAESPELQEHAPAIDYVWPGADVTAHRDPELDAATEEHEDHTPEHDHFSRFALGQLTAERRPEVSAPEPSVRQPALTKIEKNRPEQNGVKRPSAGTTCATVWDIAHSLSEVSESPQTPNGKIATLSQVVKAAEARGINKYTARTQYARWRVFHGITGRLA